MLHGRPSRKPDIGENMHSNIASPLELSHSGTTIAAHGPISGWEDDETSAAITITIQQNGVSATNKTTVMKGAASWGMTLVAPHGGEFDDGPANGTASAVVQLTNGGSEDYDWSNPVTLDD